MTVKSFNSRLTGYIKNAIISESKSIRNQNSANVSIVFNDKNHIVCAFALNINQIGSAVLIVSYIPTV